MYEDEETPQESAVQSVEETVVQVPGWTWSNKNIALVAIGIATIGFALWFALDFQTAKKNFGKETPSE